MRVIAGTAGGRPLKGPTGPGTRPTSDKVKGAIFAMLEIFLASLRTLSPVASTEGEGELATEADLWSGLRVLDLYSGTGALAIEALSRGAAWADCVEVSAPAQRVIRENLRVTGLATRARVIGGTAQQVVARPGSFGLDGPYRVALLDAPYGDASLEPTLAALARGELLSPDALVMVEHSRHAPPAEAYAGLRLLRRRRHGDTEVSIYLHS